MLQCAAAAHGGVSPRRARAGHLFGPLLIWSLNPCFLHDPFPVGDMDRPLSSWGYGRPLPGWGYGPAHDFALIGRKNGILTTWQHLYNDVHGWYRVRIEHLFGQLWHWGLVRTSGVAAQMTCTSLCVFCCISRNFAFGGRSVTLLMDHGTMSRLIFGLIKATQPPRKMKERMRQMCVPWVVRSAPPSQLVVSAKSILVRNVLVPTLVGNKLFISQFMSNAH